MILKYNIIVYKRNTFETKQHKVTYVQQGVRIHTNTTRVNSMKYKNNFPKTLSTDTREHLNIKLGGNDRITIHV